MTVPSDSNRRGGGKENAPAFCWEGNAVAPALLVPPVGVGEGAPVVYARR